MFDFQPGCLGKVYPQIGALVGIFVHFDRSNEDLIVRIFEKMLLQPIQTKNSSQSWA